MFSGQNNLPEREQLRWLLHGEPDVQLKPVFLVLSGQNESRRGSTHALVSRRAGLANNVWTF